MAIPIARLVETKHNKNKTERGQEPNGTIFFAIL